MKSYQVKPANKKTKPGVRVLLERGPRQILRTREISKGNARRNGQHAERLPN